MPRARVDPLSPFGNLKLKVRQLWYEFYLVLYLSGLKLNVVK